jgi:iron complex transport system ATP-binding protein
MTATAVTPSLCLQNVSVRDRLHDVTTAFAGGTLTVLVGENGAGKSTFLDVAAGILRPDAGTVDLDGAALSALTPPARAQAIASLGQEEPEHLELSAFARIAQGLIPKRGARRFLDDESAAAVHRAAALLHVEALLPRPLWQLSQGERRRVHVARALVDTAAAVVLVDEPHAGVDVQRQGVVSRALLSRAAQGAAVVVSCHDLALALSLGDRVLGLRAGRVVVDGPMGDLDAAAIGALYGTSDVRLVHDGDRLLVSLPRLR